MTNDQKVFLKNISEILPLISIVFLGISTFSVITYYSVFGFHPFKYLTLVDLPNYLLNDLGSLFAIVIIVSIITLTFGVIAELEKTLINKKIGRTISFFLYLSVTMVIGGLLIEDYSIGTSIYSWYFIILYSIILMFLLIFLFSLIQAKARFSESQLKEIPIDLAKSLNTTFTRRYYKLLPLLYFLIIIYFPLQSYTHAVELLSYEGNRGTLLITKDEIIRAYDKDKFIIGSTSEFYFCYNKTSGMTQIIKRTDVIKEFSFNVLRYNFK